MIKNQNVGFYISFPRTAPMDGKGKARKDDLYFYDTFNFLDGYCLKNTGVDYLESLNEPEEVFKRQIPSQFNYTRL